MIEFRAFEALIRYITSDRERITREHMMFLDFYQDLVKLIPDDLAKEFGSISAPTMTKGKNQEGYKMELNVTDYLWWKSVIEDGGRFVKGVSQVQRDIWDHLNKHVRQGALTDEQRMELIDLMKTPVDHG